MKVLLAGHIHYFNSALALVFLLFAMTVMANGSVLTSEDEAIAKMAKTIRAQTEGIELPVNTYDEEAKAQAAQLFEELRKQSSDLLQLPEKKKSSGRVIFFASHSLGEEGLEDILYTASTIEDSMVVFRGIKDESDFANSIFEIQRLAKMHSPMANVVIDPTLYRDYGINKVPTIIYLDEERSSEIARVSGLYQPKWLISKVNAGRKGDFGVRGPVEDVQERDLIEVMQDRVAKMDWDAKKEQAIERYWDKQRFIELPRAVKARIRHIDPSILVSDDIKDADGNVLIPKGTVINPLRVREFSQAVVVFDPLDEKQIALVDKKISEISQSHPQITLIVTRFDRSDGWKSYKEITDHFNAPVFKLTPDILSRFNLEYSPSVITAEGLNFVIEELASVGEEVEK